MIAGQRDYHRTLFAAFDGWEALWEKLVDLTGSRSVDGLLGMDQMGHFGPHGCDRVVDAVIRRARGRPARLCELGSGFGGALRHVLHRLPGVDVALGVELVLDHCRVGRRIGRSLGSRAGAVCGSVTALPVRSGSLDVVFAAGSVPHFADMAGALREAHRALRPGGLVVFTEEVSLVRAGAAVSERFRRSHPEGVFFLSSPDRRLRQLADAGFRDVELEDLTIWACDLLRDRVRAARLLRGTTEWVLGEAETARAIETLEAARAEFERGALQPALVSAVRPG